MGRGDGGRRDKGKWRSREEGMGVKGVGKENRSPYNASHQAYGGEMSYRLVCTGDVDDSALYIFKRLNPFQVQEVLMLVSILPAPSKIIDQI